MNLTQPLHRIIFLDDGAYLVSDPVLVTRHYEQKGESKSTEHMASTIMRLATREEVEQWRNAGA